ncbi:unnamed protein product [Prunus brigantina]
MGLEQAAERAWGKECGLVGEYRGFVAGPKGMMDLRLLKFWGGFGVSGELGKRDGSRGEEGGVDGSGGEEGGVDSSDGFVVSVIDAEVVGDEGDRGDSKGLGEWENDEKMASVEAGEKGCVGSECVGSDGGGLADGLTNGESRTIGTGWAGLVEVLICEESRLGPISN